MIQLLMSFLFIFSFCVSIVNAQTTLDDEILRRLRQQIQNGQLKVEKDDLGEQQFKSLETFSDIPDSLGVYKKVESDSLRLESLREKDKDVFYNLPFFGHEIFKTANVDFDPEIYGPVDNLYPVGPGDEIILTVWGEVELRYDLTVNRQGQIFIPEVGLTNVSGLNVTELKAKLIRVMGKSYASLLKNKAFLDVSFAKLRSIRVFVVGDVEMPGVFTVPAFTSVFNMLFYAGGVSQIGSLRNIALVRKDEVVAHLDFYQFILKGTNFSQTRLQNEDIIVIPTAKKHVFLAGAVKKPAVYELLSEEGISEIINYAGGYSDDAYTEQLQIQRIVERKYRKIIDVSYDDLILSKNNFVLNDGDRILVKRLNRDIKNWLTIDGPIYGPKRFEYKDKITISEFMSKVDSIRGDAYLDRVHITRTLADQQKQIFSINLRAIQTGAERDILLAPQDHIEIKSITTLFPPDSVSIYGAVNSAGKYLLKKQMTVKDLIFAAGGFSKNALIDKAEISRLESDATNIDNLASIYTVAIDSNYTKVSNSEDEIFYLEAYDNVFIRANSDWELQRNVNVQGEVQYPGRYSIKYKMERITDVIDRAGGLKATAYLEGAKLFRKKDGIGQIGIDFKSIFKNPEREENIYLQGGDIITIPERLYTIKVTGGVNFPSSIYFEKGEGLNYYINAAGGYKELADKTNILVRLANGKTIKQKRFLFWKYLPDDITAGSTIMIPILTDTNKQDWSGTIRDVFMVLGSVATTILIVDRLK